MLRLRCSHAGLNAKLKKSGEMSQKNDEATETQIQQYREKIESTNRSSTLTDEQKIIVISAYDEMITITDRSMESPIDYLSKFEMLANAWSTHCAALTAAVNELRAFHKDHALEAMNDEQLVTFFADNGKMKHHIAIGNKFKTLFAISLALSKEFIESNIKASECVRMLLLHRDRLLLLEKNILLWLKLKIPSDFNTDVYKINYAVQQHLQQIDYFTSDGKSLTGSCSAARQQAQDDLEAFHAELPELQSLDECFALISSIHANLQKLKSPSNSPRLLHPPVRHKSLPDDKLTSSPLRISGANN